MTEKTLNSVVTVVIHIYPKPRIQFNIEIPGPGLAERDRSDTETLIRALTHGLEAWQSEIAEKYAGEGFWV